MLTVLIDMLETAAVAICSFLVKKYIFLEPDLEGDRQSLFHGIGFFVIVAMFLLAGKDAATVAVPVLIGLNIFLARKQNRLTGLLLMIPIVGIINGLMPPIMLIPPFLLSMSGEEAQVYQLAACAVLAIPLLIFFAKGQKWRERFDESAKHRSLRTSEKVLLFVTIVFTDSISLLMIANEAANTDVAYDLKMKALISIGSAAAVFMTIMIIALILQGNKRSYYLEQLSKMQTGMISFMAEVVESRDSNTGVPLSDDLVHFPQTACPSDNDTDKLTS